LVYLYDHGYYYNWSVRAYDGTVYGNWTNDYRLNISSLVLISNPVNSVVFGSISLLASNDTTGNNPSPFVLQNDGNSFVNVSISGGSLWSSIANPSRYFQFRVGNNTAPGYSENGSFIWGSSSTLFINVSSSSSGADISTLNYSDATDSARVDINVTVPVGEPPGAKNSTITFLAVLGE